MALVKFYRSPLERSFNNLIDDLFSEFPVNKGNNGTQKWYGFVPVNIKENEKVYTLEVIAPGFEKADFKVNIDQDILTISAEKKEDPDNYREKEEGTKQVRKEYSYRSFKRSFTLDENVDASGIEAKYVNGVLTLNLPRKVEVKTPVKEITIQ